MKARIAAGLVITPEAQAEFAASAMREDADGNPSNYTVVGDVARIAIEGLLTPRPDFFTWFFGYGNTTYSSIRKGLALAELNPTVKSIQLDINSPGGRVDGLFDTLGDLEAVRKPKRTITEFAASAAYSLAALGGSIEVTNAAVEVGSIGVATSIFVDQDVVDIASTDAPNKRPDVTTEAGKAVVRAELDELHVLFVDAIARGRGTTAKDVNENFGRGGLVIATRAKQLGMVDRIQRAALRPLPKPKASASATEDVAGEPEAAIRAAAEPESKAVAEGAATTRSRSMDLNTLKTQHPETFAAVLKQGETEERDRVSAHLELAEGSGDMDTAIVAIKKGEPVTQAVIAKHHSASMKRDAAVARETETTEAAAVVDSGGLDSEEEGDFQDRVVASMRAQKGLTASQ